MLWLWDCEKDVIREIWRDIGRVKRRLNELRVPNTQKDIQQWMNICLWFAARDGQFAVCEYLLRNGGDPTWKMDGYTAIHMAAMYNRSRILQLLMDGGWSPDVTDIYGLTPLWWAGYEGHKDCVEILLSRRADPLYERTQLDNHYPFLENGVSCDDSPVAAATKCHHGDIVAMMQDIIKARLSVASAGDETAATMTDQSDVCQGCQQLTSEVRSLSAVMAKKDEQIHLLERAVNDMKEEKDRELAVKEEKLISKDEQISVLSRAWADVKRFVGKTDEQMSHMISSPDNSSSRASNSPDMIFHSSALPPHVSSPSLDPQHVLSVVQQQSSCRWYPLGRAIGLSSDQLHMFHMMFRCDCDKLQAVFDEKAREVGEVAAANMLLQACCSIQNPTIGAIEQELKKQCGCSSL